MAQPECRCNTAAGETGTKRAARGKLAGAKLPGKLAAAKSQHFFALRSVTRKPQLSFGLTGITA
jgi:hypothetical protein